MNRGALARAQELVGEAGEVDGMRLVGVDGPSGAGKSTFALALADLLDAPVIPTDDFISWGDYDSWWPRFERDVLEPLAHGIDVQYHPRDWTGDEFGRSLLPWSRGVSWAPVVVVEGVTSTRSSAAERYAVRIWVETPPDERLRRGIARDGEAHRSRWVDAAAREDAFFSRDPVQARAHLIVRSD